MADNRKKRKAKPLQKSRFAPSLVIYVWIMLILIGVGLGFLHKYLTAYENSLPEHVVEACQASLRETVPAAAFRDLERPDALPQSAELKAELLEGLFRDAVLQKDPINSREYHLIYKVKAADGQVLGSMVFEPVGKGSFGLPDWEMVEEHYDFSAFYHTTGVVVPSDYRVYLDDTLLGTDCIRETGIPYHLLSILTEDYSLLPTMVRYETPPFLGEAALRILNEKGETRSEEELTEELFLDRCPEEAREQIGAFLPEFVDLYIHFSADINNSAKQYKTKHLPMVVPDSPLFVRMDMADEGFGYSATRSVELISVEPDRIMDLGGGRYAVDLRYTEEILGSDREVGPVQKEQHVMLVLMLSGDQLKAEALYFL